MQQQVSIWNVVKLAGAYIAFTIGSGFATGQEVLQFFTSYGPAGYIGALVSMFLFAAMGAALMVKGHELNLTVQTEIFRYYCGKYIGYILEIFTIVCLFCVVSIMFAGSGAVAGEYFGVGAEIGKLGMAILCVMTVLLGLNGLVDIIGAIGPVITVFTILIGIVTAVTSTYYGNDLTGAQVQALFDLRATAGWWFGAYEWLDTAWFSGVLYAACMVLGGIPFLAGLGTRARNRQEAIWGGVMGGVFLMLSVIMIVFAMLCYPDQIVTYEVPNLFLAEQHLPILAMIFSVVLLLGIYSTAAPMFWLVLNRIQGFGLGRTPMLAVTMVLGIVAYFGAQIGFGKLIGILYPLMGQVGLIMIPVVFLRAGARKAELMKE